MPIGQSEDLNFAVPGSSFIEFFHTFGPQRSGVEAGEDEESEDEESGEEDASDPDDDRVTITSAMSGFRSESAGMVIVVPLSGSVHNVARDQNNPWLSSLVRAIYRPLNFALLQ